MARRSDKVVLSKRQGPLSGKGQLVWVSLRQAVLKNKFLTASGKGRPANIPKAIQFVKVKVLKRQVNTASAESARSTHRQLPGPTSGNCKHLWGDGRRGVWRPGQTPDGPKSKTRRPPEGDPNNNTLPE